MAINYKELICKPLLDTFGGKMETREEYMRDQFNDRRRDFLRDFSFGELLDLLSPADIDIFKEEIIDFIINECLDSQCNLEVK